MEVINVKKPCLLSKGYEDFNHWISQPDHIYIGGDLTHYENGPVGSKWQNPFSLKKYGRDECIKLYEKYIRTHPTLLSDIHELKGKILGCWCYPELCHGDILIQLLQDCQIQNQNTLKSEVVSFSEKRSFTRDDFKEIAGETLQILEEGFYVNQHGSTMSLRKSIDFAVQNTFVLEQDDPCFVDFSPTANFNVTSFSTTQENTTNATIRVCNEINISNVAVLNFANAKQPGGGFIRGANTQEESLSRSSALYSCLASSSTSSYYTSNLNISDGIYPNNIIYSPSVPIFRNEAGRLLDIPVHASIISSSPVNRGHTRSHFKDKEVNEVVSRTMKNKIGQILQAAAANGHDILVLGAFGCGVFRNDPEDVARWFYEWLTGPFNGVFSDVIFAIPDSLKGKTFSAFQKLFNEKTGIQLQPQTLDLNISDVQSNRNAHQNHKKKKGRRHGRKKMA